MHASIQELLRDEMLIEKILSFLKHSKIREIKAWEPEVTKVVWVSLKLIGCLSFCLPRLSRPSRLSICLFYLHFVYLSVLPAACSCGAFGEHSRASGSVMRLR